MSRMSRRQTVVSKAGKVYKYRQVDPTAKRIRVNVGYGYEDGSMTKLAFKNGKLTEAGKMFRDSINDIQDVYERKATLAEFDKYVAMRSNAHQTTTVASFESHMLDESYDRLLNNLNIDKKEVIDKLKAKKGEKIKLDDDTIKEIEDAYREKYGKDIEVTSEVTPEDIVNDYYLFNKYITFSYEDGWSIK